MAEDYDADALYDTNVDPAVYENMKPWEIMYAGISSEDIGFIVGHYSKPIAPLMTRSAVDIPSRFGDLYLGTSYGAKTFNIPVTIVADDSDDYYRILENMSNALIDPFEDPGDVYPIVFGDDPHKAEYYGHFSEIPDPTFIAENEWVSTTTLVFICADPKGYLPEEDIKITEPISQVPIKGNSEAYPIIHADVKKPLEYFGYFANGEYVSIGTEKNYDTDDPNYIQNKEPLAYHDTCSTLDNFTVGKPDTFKITHGVVSGNVDLRGDSGITVKFLNNQGQRDWGTKQKLNGDWYGPCVTHDAVTNPTEDWEVAVRVKMYKYYSRSKSKIELYFLDTEGNRRGRFCIKAAQDGTLPGCFLEFGSVTDWEAGKRKYMIGTESNTWKGPRKYQVNNPYHKVVLSNKKKVPVTVWKRSGRKKVKKTEYKWKVTAKKKLDDWNDKSVFTDFYGIVRIRKVGNDITWSITKCRTHPDQSPIDTLAKGVWKMNAKEAKEFGFTLSKVACYMGKGAIEEDYWNPVKAYHEPYCEVTDICIWNIIDGGNKDKSKPAYIFQPGDEIIIDTERKHTYKNGIPIDEMTSFGSLYPTWNKDKTSLGHVEVGFTPPPGEKVDIGVTYRPTYQ